MTATVAKPRTSDLVREHIREELEEIRAKSGGLLYASDVVAYARKHKSSALHGQFQWDTGRAAAEYWLDQARRIIRVHVKIIRHDTEPVRAYVSLVDDRNEPKGGYRAMVDVLSSDEQRARLIREAMQAAHRWMEKYRHLEELAEIFAAIESAA